MKLNNNLISFIIILLIFLVVVIYLGFFEDNQNVNDTILSPIIYENNLLTENFATDNNTDTDNNIDELKLHLINHDNPNLGQYVRKSELDPDDRCTVSNAEDRDKYLHKSDIPAPPPEIDMNKYILKSSIPPEKVCPPQKEIDYSKYVLKSTIPPPQKCPACICPKVKVSAGLCRKCPPPPMCPAPEACPPLPNCPEPKPCPVPKDKLLCPASPRCPNPPPINIPESRVNPNVSQIKYIKVPTVITKTKLIDSNGNVVNEEITTSENIPEVNNSIPEATMSNITKQAIQLLEKELIEGEEQVYNNRNNSNNSNNSNNRLSYKCDIDNDLNSQQKKYMRFSEPYLLN